MKKLTALLLALCLGLMLIPAMAEENSVLGTWYLVSVKTSEAEVDPAAIGMQASVDINEDGTIVTTVAQSGKTQQESGTWTEADGKITVVTENNTSEAVIEDGLLVVTRPDVTMKFSRSQPENAQVTVPAAPVAVKAESAEAFAGTWSVTGGMVMGVYVPLDQLSAKMGLPTISFELTAENAKVSIGETVFDTPVVFEDGAIKVRTGEQQVLTLQLTEDGGMVT